MKSEKTKEYVIVRSHTAGVHAGFLESRKGDAVVLLKSRRLWRWYGASLSQVGAEGLAVGDNRIGMVIQKTEIVSPQGFEIIYCTKKAQENIEAYPAWKV